MKSSKTHSLKSCEKFQEAHDKQSRDRQGADFATDRFLTVAALR